jgi:hypothetical protein
LSSAVAALDRRGGRMHGAAMSRAVIVLAAVLAVAGCGALPIGARVGTPAGVTPGTAVDPGERPDSETCEAAIRSDMAGALAVRAVLASPDFGSLPIATDEAAARRAAADPVSDLGAFGIPVTGDELAASLASGIEIDSTQPLVARIRAGSGAHGDLWIDGSGLVVAVMSRDAAAPPWPSSCARTRRPSGSPSSRASAADESRTRASAIVAGPLEAHGLRGGRAARMARPLLSPDGLESIERGEGATAALVGIAVEPVGVLDRHEDGDRSMVALDEEALAGRGRVQDRPERAPEVHRADRSHSWL